MHGFIEYDDPETKIIEQFLKPGAWNNDSLIPNGLGVRLVYSVKPGILRLSIDSGKIRRPASSPERSGIVLSANYHVDLSGSDLVEDAAKAIAFYKQHCKHFAEITKTIFSLED